MRRKSGRDEDIMCRRLAFVLVFVRAHPRYLFSFPVSSYWQAKFNYKMKEKHEQSLQKATKEKGSKKDGAGAGDKKAFFCSSRRPADNSAAVTQHE